MERMTRIGNPILIDEVAGKATIPARSTHYGFDVRSIGRDGKPETVRYLILSTILYPDHAPLSSGESVLLGVCDPSNMRAIR